MATEGVGATTARELGLARKVSPCIDVPGNSIVTLADISGSGAIQQMSFTVNPKVLAGARFAHLLGRRRDALVEVPAGRLLLHGVV